MAEKKNILMVTVSGQDRPGIIATFTRVLMEHQVDLVDIEQASLQNLLGLYFLLDLTTANQSADSVIKDLLYEASQLNLTLNFRLFAKNEIKPVHQKSLYVLTHFGSTQALAELSRILGEEDANIETISSLSLHGARSIEMTINVNGTENLGRLKERIMAKSCQLGMDLSFQKMEAYRKNKRLVFFDMDSTLVDMDIIDEMAKKADVHSEVARITEKAMRGDLDFESALVQRVALLKGLTFQNLVDVREHLPLSEGVEELVLTLKWLGYKLGIITGGFDFFAQHLKERLGLDYAFANRLEIRDGVLTGRVQGPIIDAAEKAKLVNQVAFNEKVPLDQTVVIGDGTNDALMLGQAGLGIAYGAKKSLHRVANASLGKARLSHIFHLLGITEEDIHEARRL